ncbi:DUF6318 family protein [Isoptericola sp. b408]|uniref:DUF6318 family protein n=1 Tax=Isoptericola sp. b408 TaxID=3064653 RepID=UPI00271422FD|nr:DUF6318 family protein [Isoptericola sp. b408]MDO8151855.1 DUF6318 family protein [Isoptericola sp. b408]
MARTPRHHSPLRRLVPALVVLGLLAGCTGGDPEPEAQASEPSSAPVTTAPSEEPTPSPSPSPTGPTKPERPAAMDKKNAEGAAAAAEHFIELYDYTLKTGDTEALRTMSHRSCGFCDETLAEAESIQTKGETYEGGELSFSLIESFQRDPVTGLFPMDVDVRQAPASIASRSGEVVWEQGATTTEARIEMGRRDGTWVVVEIAGRPK